VIPAYREAATIRGLVQAVRAQGLPVIVVDDGSPDATAAEAEQGGATVLRHARNQGKGLALATGCDAARRQGFAAVITMDGDGQHDPADLPAFLSAYAAGGAAALIGNRMADTAAMPGVRRATNRLMSWLLSRMMGQRVPDTQCGYRLYRCAALPARPPTAARFAAESEILLELADAGARIGSVPIRTIYRHETSKINPVIDTWRFLAMILRRRRRRRRS